MTRCGKNLLDPALCIASGVSNNVTLTRNADGSYTATGTPSGDISQYAFTVYIHTDISVYRQGVTYYCRTDTRSNHFKARIAYQNGVNDFKDKFTFDRENMTAIRLYLQVPIGEYVDGMTIHIGLYLEEDADWEPYCGDSCAAELPETVYGGTLDWETGVVTVTHGPIASYTGEELPGEWLSDRDVYAGGTVPTNGAQVVYKLAEPYTIQLTPRQILALAGKNNIYANSGEVEVRGRTDPVYLTNTLMERIAALEAAAINA